ncbi:MAG: hypothetical protein WAW13_01505 [Minisyncoccia bacterium]
MNNIAHLDTTTLDTAAKFFRTMRKAGADFTGPMQSITQRANLVEYLKLGCPKVDATGVVTTPSLPGGADLARILLRDDFIAPKDVASMYGFSYSEDQLAHFANTLPDFETLMWLRKNGFMLVAGPTTDLNLLGVRALNRSLFYNKNDDEAWFEEVKHTFTQADMVKGGEWLMLRKGAVPHSRSKNWGEQYMLVDDLERIPNTAEVSYGVTVYRKLCSVYLLPNFYVRTSSVDADGNLVCVGGFDELGIHIVSYMGNDRIDFVGVSSALNHESLIFLHP